MALEGLLPDHTERHTVLAWAALATVGIFVLDTVSDVDVTVSELYVAVLLVISRVVRPHDVALAASVFAFLTALSHFVSPGDPYGRTALINLAFALMTIAFCAFIIWKYRSAELKLRELRDQLARLMRVATLGELIASITHEVNQPIAGVITNAQASLRWLAAEPPNMEEARHAVERIVRDGNRAGQVIGRVRGLVKKSSPKMAEVDVNETVLEVLALTRGEVERHRATVQAELSNNLPPVSADRVQVQQVILNLVLNGLEAVSDNPAGSRKLKVVTHGEGETEARISVHDSGNGIDPLNSEQIFQPFYTTKREGMGLGLAISRSIAQAHGGRLWATSNEPEGAVFHFALPVLRRDGPIGC
jgi:C4-dicarboxylate-specific signal transduction histidine kinase